MKYCVVYDNNSSCLDLILKDDSDNSGSSKNGRFYTSHKNKLTVIEYF